MWHAQKMRQTHFFNKAVLYFSCMHMQLFSYVYTNVFPEDENITVSVVIVADAGGGRNMGISRLAMFYLT